MAGRLWVVALVALAVWCGPAAAQDGGAVQALLDDKDLRAAGSEANKLYNAGKYKEAAAIADNALATAEGRYGPDHIVVGEALSGLAFFYSLQGLPTESVRLQKRALSIIERAHGSAPTALCLRFLLLAHHYRQLNRYAEALPISELALAWAEKAFGPDRSELHQFLDALADVYMARGRYADAERVYRRAYSVTEQILYGPAKTGMRRKFLVQLAGIYAQRGYVTDAQALLKRADAVDGMSHLKTPRSLASTYVEQGRYAEAETAYLQELAKLEDAASDAPTKEAIAALKDEMQGMGSPKTKEDFEARPLTKELVRLQATLPPEDQIAAALHSLGGAYHKLGKYAEAEAFLNRAIGLRDHLDYSEEISIHLSLARLHTNQERYADAETAYTRVLDLYARREPWLRGRLPGPETAKVLSSLGHLALKLSQLERAEELHKRALKVLEEWGPDRFDVGATLNDLAELYRSRGRFADAEPLYRRALQIYEKGNMSPNHAAVRTVLANLVALYIDQGRTPDAEKLKRGALHRKTWLQ